MKDVLLCTLILNGKKASSFTDQHKNEEAKMKEHICIRCGPISDNSLRVVHQVPRLVRKKIVDLVVCIQLLCGCGENGICLTSTKDNLPLRPCIYQGNQGRSKKR